MDSWRGNLSTLVVRLLTSRGECHNKPGCWASGSKCSKLVKQSKRGVPIKDVNQKGRLMEKVEVGLVESERMTMAMIKWG
jgi:positive regulator of sigma E activity